MSLGSLAVGSYKYDPACKAVRRLVDAGIGMEQKVYGHLLSPGNEPSAMTVALATRLERRSRREAC